MLKNKIQLTTLCMALVGTSGASVTQAAENFLYKSGVYLGIDAGEAEARKYCDNVTDCSSGDTSVRGEIGYQINNMFAGELGYTSFGTLVDSKDNAFNAKQNASAWTASLLAGWPFTDRFSVFGRVGVAAYSFDNSGTFQGLPVKDDEGTEPYYGVGLKFSLNDSWALRAEYQRYTDISGLNNTSDDVQGWYAGGVFIF